MPCKHADLMMIYAKQAAEMDEPWKLWEGKPESCEKFVGMGYHFIFEDTWEFRLKTKTININGRDVPEPMREKPELMSLYWTLAPTTKDGVTTSTWMDDEYDNFRFNHGVCHLTLDNCIAHAKALFSFSEIKE